MKLPNPYSQVVTSGVHNQFEPLGSLGRLYLSVIGEYQRQPDECLDGGNDKRFFSFRFDGIKLFVAENEVGGLTVMFPDEY